MRIDRQIWASLAASAVAFWLVPALFPGLQLFAFGGLLLTQLIIAVGTWLLFNLSFLSVGGGRRGKRG